MTIFFDGRWIGPHGIGRFAREVQSAVPNTGLSLPGRPSDPLDTFRLAMALKHAGAGARDTFFSPGYNAPLWFRGRLVFTIHDLNHIDRPENASALKSIYYERVMKPACRRADKILTVSEFSRRRIVEWSGVSSDRVVNVGNGVDPSFNVDAAPHRPGYRYVLCVGNRKQHKNEARVMRAFARLGDRSLHLVYTGDASPDSCSSPASCTCRSASPSQDGFPM